MESMTSMIEQALRDRAAAQPTTSRDLTDPLQNAEVLSLADELLSIAGNRLLDLRQSLITDADFVSATAPVFHEALAAAVGKLRLQQAVKERSAEAQAQPGAGAETLRVSVVFAMYGEGSRILQRHQDPHGEDFLRRKVEQLTWLFDRIDSSSAVWHLFAIDDGCPDEPSSSSLAEAVVSEDGLSDRVTVLRLADAIENGTAVSTPSGTNEAFSAMTSTDDSRKGGSILYGLHAAMERFGYDGSHLLLYTDADLSANLTQLGSLIEPLLVGGYECAIGQRYGVPGSILVKAAEAMTEPRSTGTKPDKMIVLFRHQVRVALIAALRPVLDTQAGFKAFTAPSLARSVAAMSSFNETFDVELLIHTSRTASDLQMAIAVEPIVFTEDFGQTNFPSVDPGERHLAMIKQIVDVYDRFVADHEPVEGSLAELLEACRSLTVADYVAIIEDLQARDAQWPADSLFDRPIDIGAIVGLVSST